jgi:hypothetical protein
LLRGGIANATLSLQPVGADPIAETQAAELRNRREGLSYRLLHRATSPFLAATRLFG